jgi:hypothetical protein
LWRDLLGHIHHGARIKTEEVGDNGDHHAAYAQSTSDHAHPTSILDVFAFPLLV